MSEHEKTLVAHYLFCMGHACVTFIKEYVCYLDRSPGQRIHRKVELASDVLKEVDGLSITLIQGKVNYERGVVGELGEARMFANRQGLRGDLAIMYKQAENYNKSIRAND